MSSLQLLKLAELGRNPLACRRKILLVASGCLFAGGTMAYMYYQNQNRSCNPDHSGNDIDGENGEEKKERNGLDNKPTEKIGHTKGLKSLRILAAILLSRIGQIGMRYLYALMTRAGRGMLQSMHYDFAKADCTSQEDLENYKTGKYHKAKEKRLHGSVMPEMANESNVSETEDFHIVEAPSKNLQKKKSLRAQVGAETMTSKLIEHKVKLVDSFMPASENESIGSNAEDLKIIEVASQQLQKANSIVEVPSKNSPKKESLVAQLDVETTDRKLIGRKAKEHELQGSLMPSSKNEPDGSITGNLKTDEVPKKNPQKEKSLGAEVDVETKKRKLIEGGVAADALRVCNLCSIVCNSKSVFENHIKGQKHATMLKNQEAPGAVQSLKGDVCKIKCTDQEVPESHNIGINHKTKKKQHNDSLMPASESEPIGTDTEGLKNPQVTKKRLEKRKRVLAQLDLETTKNKPIEKGVAPYAVKVCSLCNVLCTNESVFNDHFAGKRHASMLKKQE